MSARHIRSRLWDKRAVRAPVIVISALMMIGGGMLILREVSADADGCSSGIRLTVAADPAIAEAVAEIGTQWTERAPAIEGTCVRVEVSAKPSYQMAEGLATWAGGRIDVAAKPAPTPPESDLPVVWIPDSSYWTGRVFAVDRNLFEGEAKSVAASPIVLAVPETVARGLDAEATQRLDAARIRKLVADATGKSRLKLGLVEPRRDTAGLIGAMLLSDAVVASPADLPRLVGAYRAVGAQVDDTAALWEAFAKAGVTGAPVSEQAVLAYNGSGTTSPMAALSLADLPTLDFPYAIRSRQPRSTAAAAMAFRDALLSGQYREVLAKHRLRSPDGSAATGFPTGHGVTTAAVHVQPLADMAKVASVLRVWTNARSPSRVLAMVDASASMNQILAGSGKTRLQVLREAATSGLALFTDTSELGLWAFAGPGHRELAPIGPLNRAHRDELVGKLNSAGPLPTDVTPLYQSITDGYQVLLNGYKSDLRNTLVVFTDGRDNTGRDIRAVRRELEVLADVTRPIRVILLGVGSDVNMEELQQIAHATGGAAFQVNTPDEMQSIFLRALLT